LILSFLQRARRRFLWNEVIAQFALGAALLMGGAVLLLIIGTGILDWRIIVALCLTGLGVAIYRTVKRIPSEYKIAVLVDSHAHLHDALSTAYHFSDPGRSARISSSVQEVQMHHAEALLPSIDLESAIPFRIPRALYAMGVLFLVASSLFALRYGTSKKLDWRAPISQLLIESLGLRDPEAKQLASNTKKKTGDNTPGEALDTSGNPIPKSELNKKDQDPTANNAMESVGDPQAAGEKSDTASKGEGKGESADKNGEQGESEKAQGGTPQNGKNANDNPSGSQDGPQQGEQAGGKQNDSNQSSLLSKMKDAMSNLLSKAKPQSGQQAGKKESGSQGQQQQKAQSQQQNGEKGSQQNQQGESQDSADSQQGEQPGDSDNQQDSQGKGSGKNSDKQASSQPGSGIGKQDGAKEIAAAQQQAAMGKLSEIIGKRSANVSGEMMLDVQSGPQQLRTQYSKSGASHAASSGEISRDEVPVALQGYVQQYFDQVRKSEHTGTAAAPAKPKAAPPSSPQPPSATKP
jgi:hypothetical protein